MNLNRMLVAAVCCVLFAFGPAGADDQNQPEPKKLALLPRPVIEAAEAVTILNDTEYPLVVRVPLFNALLVCGTDKELKDIPFLLRPL